MQTIDAIIDLAQLEAVSGGIQVPPQKRPPPDTRDDLDRYFDRHLDSGTDKNFKSIVPKDTDKKLDRKFDPFATPPRTQGT